MYEEYNAQQLSEFLELAAKYLEDEGMEFVSDELHLDPNNPEDVAKFIAIAFAEHGDFSTKTNPGQVATNTPGDSNNSRGPWQIHIPTWKKVLEQYDIFANYDDMTIALDNPELNAIAAIIVAQQGAVEKRGEMYDGINNWETVQDTKKYPEGHPRAGERYIVDSDPYGIKKGGTPIYEGTSNFSPDVQTTPPLGQVEEETEYIQEQVEGVRNNRLQPDMALDIDFMKKQLNLGKNAKLFSDEESYFSLDNSQRLSEKEGRYLNGHLKNSLLNTEIDDLSDNQVIELYGKLVKPHIPVQATIRDVTMEGNGSNILDMLHEEEFDNQSNYYDTKTGQVVKGSVLNKTEGFTKDSMYRFYTDRVSGFNHLKNLHNVYTYYLRTKNPFIKLSSSVDLSESSPGQRMVVPGSSGMVVPRDQFVSGGEANNTRFARPPGQNLGEGGPQTRASDTFLNNMEKILRVGKKNNPEATSPPEDRQRDFLRRR